MSLRILRRHLNFARLGIPLGCASLPIRHRKSRERRNTAAFFVELLEIRSLPSGVPSLINIASGAASSDPRYLTDVNGTLFFSANAGGNGYELWKSDGTSAGTVLVKDINTGGSNSYPRELTNVNGTLFFRANDGTNGYELWKSDGTPGNTVMVKDINTGAGHSLPSYLTNVNGTLFFGADDGTNGFELWKSDGTSANTVLVKDINTGGHSIPAFLTNVNGTLFFSADDGTNGGELWKSDGSTANTVLVKDINTGGHSGPGGLINVNGVLLFTADDGTNGVELWKSDGTSPNTVLVKDIFTGSTGSFAGYLTNVNGTLFFTANDGANGFELWKSDGTTGGTVLVKDINTIGGSGSDLTNITNVNGTVFFAASDNGTYGNELWKSDGTTGGTVLVKDINTGGNSTPGYLTNVNGTLYFGASDGSNGVELWKSDGSSAGTVLVQDIQSGGVGSYPLFLTNMNGSLFFTADDGSTGRELWVLAPILTPTLTIDDVTAAEGVGLIFTVTLDNAVAGGTQVVVSLADVSATGGAPALASPEDYDNVVTNLTFTGTAGETQQFTVNTLNDAVLESSETFTVNLDALNVLVTDSDTATGTITDNDSAAVTVADVSAAEGGGLLFTVTLNNAVQGGTQVVVSLADLSATGGAPALASPEDYDNVVTNLTFTGTAGETQQFTVNTLNDAVLESSETFTVNLNALNVLVTDSDTATGTITDNDSAAVTVADVSATEGGDLLFTVTLNNAVQGGTQVVVSLADVSATGGAPALASPEDYDNVVTNLTFTGTAGETQQFTVNTLDDAVLESSETFTVNLNALNVLVTDTDTATGTITDNDNAAVTVVDVSAAEGGGLLFTVTLNNAVQGGTQVAVTLADVTATGGAPALETPEDYDNVVTNLTFTGTAGETQQFTVNTLNDLVVESTESFTVNLNALNALVTDTDTASGTITDNDSAAVTVADVSAAEGGGLLFTVTLNNAVQGGTQVVVSLADVTATGGAQPLASPEDYDNVVANLTFAGTAGETQQFTVNTLNDLVVESTESFTVNLNALNALVTDTDTASGTITDDDFFFTWDGGGTDDNWTTAGNWVGDIAPFAGADLVFDATGVAVRPSPLNDFAPGTSFGTITMGVGGYTIGGNTVSLTSGMTVSNETGSSTVSLVVSGAGSLTKSGAGLLTLSGTNTYTGTTTINAGTLLVNGSQASSSISLNGGTLGGTGTVGAITSAAGGGTLDPATTLTTGILSSGDLNLSATATFQVELNGTTVGTDYDQLSVIGVVNLGGATLSTSVGFTPTTGNTLTIINNDGVDAVVGTFTGLAEGATFSSGGRILQVSYAGGDGNDVVLTDVSLASLSIEDVTAAEGGGLLFTVTLNNAVAGGTNVDVTLSGGTAIGGAASLVYPEDYENVVATLTFAGTAGETQMFTVATTGDAVAEDTETFFVSLNAINSLVADSDTATGTINNDDSAAFSVANASATEGSNVVFTVSLSNPVDVTTSVTFTTSTGSATIADNDYTAINSQTVTFSAGTTSQQVTVNTTADSMVEADETFTVALDGLTNGGRNVTISGTNGTATGTINNDDSAVFSVANASAAEGTGIVFTITLSNPVDVATSVTFTTSDNSATIADNDYTAISGQIVTFNAGTTSQTVTVNTTADSTIEPNETFTVTLGDLNAGGRNVTGSGATATGTITDDDGETTINISDVTLAEGNDGTRAFVFTVTRTGATVLESSVVVSTADGTAKDVDRDYIATNSSLTFATGDTSKMVTVTVNGDTKFEADETFTITLSNASNATIGMGTGTGTILNDDVCTNVDIVTNLGLSNPRYLTDVSGTLFFVVNDGNNGEELWKSDGTSNGTVLVKDIRPGSESSSPLYLTNVNGTLFFSANDGSNGRELWKSNGTSVGTVLVKDIRPGSESSSPLYLTNVNGTLFFSAEDGSAGRELWTSNGTSDGTMLVTNIRPGILSSFPKFLTNVSGTLFFSASDGVNGYELWKSDGTSAGTVLVKDINTVTFNSSPRYLTNVNGTLFFVVNDGNNGEELWKSDGTSNGTVSVKDIRPGSESSSPLSLTNVHGTLFFSASDMSNGYELWRSDGTSAGTVLVKDIRTGSGSSNPRNLTNLNGTLFFNASDMSNGYELWKSDGTSAGTILVKDIRTGSGSSNPRNLTNLNGTLLFNASDVSNGYELWKSDGTSAGTVLVKDIRLGSSSSFPRYLTNVNGALFFSADDGSGAKLWIMNSVCQNTNTIQLAASTYSTSENSGSVSITVTRSGDTTSTASVDFATANGTALAGADYTGTPGTITFAAGETSKTISVPILTDAVYEPDETFTVTLTSASTNASLGSLVTATITITANGTPPTFSIGNVTMAEGNTGVTEFVFTVTKTGATALESSVIVYTADGTTTAGEDYTAVGDTTLTFGANETTKTVSVLVNGDINFEPDETFQVNLKTPTNATIGVGAATGKITDDDFSLTSVFQFQTASVTKLENSGTATITVDRVTTTLGVATVLITSTSGTGEGNATAGLDYEAISNQIVTFAFGETTATFTVKILNDIEIEGNETLTLTLTNPSVGTLGNPATVTLVIQDNDKASEPIFADEDGDKVVVSVTSPATLTVVQDDPDGDGRGAAELIAVTNASSTTVLTVTVTKAIGGDGFVNVLHISSNAGLSAINATTANILGGGSIIANGSLNVLTVRDIGAASTIRATNTATTTVTITGRTIGDGAIIDAGQGIISALTFKSIGTATITANNVGTLRVTGDAAANLPGDFKGNLTLAGANLMIGTATLTSMTVAGGMNSANINVTGNIGTITTRSIANSTITATGNVTTLNMGDVAGININAGGRVSSLTAKNITGATISANSIGTLTTTGDTVRFLPGDFSGILTLAGPGVQVGTNLVTLGTMSVKGGINDGSKIDVTGNITTLTVGRAIANTTINATGFVTTLQAGTFTGANITANKVGTLKAIGNAAANLPSDFSGTLTLAGVGVTGNTLGAMSAGKMDSPNIDVTGNIGVFTVTGAIVNPTIKATGNIGTLTAGDLTGATITANSMVTLKTTGRVLSITTGSGYLPGDFSGTLTLAGANVASGTATLGTMTIAGGINASTINVTGGITTFTVKKGIENTPISVTGRIGTLTAGAFTGANITAKNMGTLKTTGFSGLQHSFGDFSSSTLMLTGPGYQVGTNPPITLSTMTVAGGISSANINVTGTITTFTVGRAIVNTTINATERIGTLTAKNITGTNISADSMTSLSVTKAISVFDNLFGDFRGSTLTLAGPGVGTANVTLGTMTVAGGISSSNIQVTGNITTFKGASPIENSIINTTGKIGTLTAGAITGATISATQVSTFNVTGHGAMGIPGNISGSTLTLSGVGVPGTMPTLGTMTVTGGIIASNIQVTGNVTSLTVGAIRSSSVQVNGNIGTLKVTSITNGIVDSNIFAASRINTVTISKAITDNDGESFGIFANSFGTVTYAGATVVPDKIVGDFQIKTFSTPGISISNAPTVNEVAAGTVNAVFTVTLSTPSPTEVTVNFETSDGTARVLDGDYATNTGTVTFAPFTTSQTISVIVNGDNVGEGNENFNVTLSSLSSNAALGNATGVATIADPLVETGSPGQFRLQTANVTKFENSGSTTFTVERLPGTAGAATVLITSANVTATAGLDYEAITQTLTFADGQTSATFAVKILNDTEIEPNETLTLTLSNPSVGSLASPSTATLVIQDNDKAVSVNTSTIQSATLFEEDGDKVVVSIGSSSGTLTVVQDDPDGNGRGSIELIAVTNASNTSVKTLTITTTKYSGDGFANVLHISSVAGPMIISAASANILGGGSIIVNGRLSALTVRDIGAATTIRATMPISTTISITARTIGDGAIIDAGDGIISVLTAKNIGAATITANRMGTLTVAGDAVANLPGDFNATLTLAGVGLSTVDVALTKMTVAGGMNSANINVTGNITSITSRSIANSSIKATGNVTTLNMGDIAGININAGGRVSSLTAKNITGATISAKTMGTLTTTGEIATNLPGDFSGTLTLTGPGVPTGNPPTVRLVTLGTMSVKGGILNSSVIQITDSVTTITAGRAIVNTTINVAGSLTTLQAGTFTGANITANKVGTLKAIGNAAANLPADFSGTLTLAGVGVTGNTLGTMSAGRMNSPNIDVIGNIGTITVTGAIVNPTIKATGSVTTLTAGDLTGATISANSMGTLKTIGRVLDIKTGSGYLPGDFSGTLTIAGANVASGTATLGTMSIAGGINASTINVTGGITTFTVIRAIENTPISVTGRISTLTAGAITGATITAKNMGILKTTGFSGLQHSFGDFSSSTLMLTGPGYQVGTNPPLTLSTMNIKGGINSSNIQITGKVFLLTTGRAIENTSITATEGEITTLNAKGITSTTIFASSMTTLSVTSGSVFDNLFGDFRASTLTLAGPGVGTANVTLGTMTVAGGISSSNIQVTGNITTFKGASSIENSIINTTGKIGTLTAGAITGGTITANSVGTLTVNGVSALGIPGNIRGSTLTLAGVGVPSGQPTLGTLNIKAIHSAVVKVNGDITSFTAGRIEDSTIFAGFTPTDSANPMDGGAFTGYRIGALTLQNSVFPQFDFVSGVVAASHFGPVTILGARTNNDGNTFGVLGQAITVVNYKGVAVTPPVTDGNFQIKAIPPPPTISISDAAKVTEPATGTVTASFTVTLSAASASPVTVNYSTADGTAKVAENDYVTNSGTVTFTPSGPLTQTIMVTVNSDNVTEGDHTFTVVLENPVNAAISDAAGLGTIADPVTSILVTGADAGASPHVKVYNASTGDLKFSFFAYDAAFQGGVRVAAGDVNGDGTADIITGAGPGGGPNVKVFSGVDGSFLQSFFAYDPLFTGGVFVAAGDVNGDGFDDIITGADAGASGGHVKAFSGVDLSVLHSFFAYGSTFTGGVRVAAGDVNGDGRDDIITSPGAGSGPNMKVFDGASQDELSNFFAYNPLFTGGVFVAAGDVNSDGKADIITGPGSGGGPNVIVFDATTLAQINSFFAYASSFTGGVRVAAADWNNDGRDDIITSPGPGGTPNVKVFDGTTLASLDSFFTFDQNFVGGVFVGGK